MFSLSQKFSKKLEFIEKEENIQKIFFEKIIEEVLNSQIQNIVKILKYLGRELVKQKPVNLNKLPMDEIAVVKGQKNII